MKRCPQCGREYDNTMMFCLDDGAELLYGPAKSEPPASEDGQFADAPATAILSAPPSAASGSTSLADQSELKTAILHPLPAAGGPESPVRGFDKRLLLAPLLIAFIALGGYFGYKYYSPAKQIESIAVMPF